MVNFEKEVEEITKNLEGYITEGDKKLIAERLKRWYNYGKGWKRDRMFLSKEKHEKKYLPRRKTPTKVYKKKEV